MIRKGGAKGFALFDTAIGRCGIAWGGRGITGVQLPEAREADTLARLAQRFPAAREAAPPPAVKRAIAGVVALLRGKARDLGGVALDMEGVPPFHRRVYQEARAIPPGATLSYGDMAARLGSPGAARAVGQALRRNPFAIVVPCHRVLAAGGKVGGFTATGGVDTKLRMLAIERGGERAGAAAVAAPAASIYTFKPRAALRHLKAADPALGRLIESVGPFAMRIDDAPSLFLALAEAIVYQQLTGKAAATIFSRVRALFPDAPAGGFTPAEILGATDAQLRGAGLSRGKLLALRDLARRVDAGELPDLTAVATLDDEAIVECLTEVRGIGRWTVEMLLMFRLGRPDVLPCGDYGVRKGFAAAFRTRALPAPADVAKRGERWRPYRSVAAWYLWRAAERAGRRAAAAGD